METLTLTLTVDLQRARHNILSIQEYSQLNYLSIPIKLNIPLGRL
jgi:hypothetical protein